jgi:hypothetical protein
MLGDRSLSLLDRWIYSVSGSVPPVTAPAGDLHAVPLGLAKEKTERSSTSRSSESLT